MAVPEAAVIVLVILGCIMLVLSGYSTHYLMTNGFYGLERDIDPTAEQRVYMRQLRLRDLHWMAREHRVKSEDSQSAV
ncbi:hypothetical protein ASPBRDRAFT_281372 [Aspergillus brasiliensis CBS 101740]|uniref:Uncharacterized protein n=1 Tax=Aspergillus brasiliensis (strain CBS 101740 / IMI 381727 / IBT 21946) TaxID=767769 RepID=A0A1L9UD02_ASPBC|nr:hypothetical protein ASPBRDRAFT_281372 [Aspergillus brasiliensis CBS 101740]